MAFRARIPRHNTHELIDIRMRHSPHESIDIRMRRSPHESISIRVGQPNSQGAEFAPLRRSVLHCLQKMDRNPTQKLGRQRRLDRPGQLR
jgi:hypothetical protein